MAKFMPSSKPGEDCRMISMYLPGKIIYSYALKMKIRRTGRGMGGSRVG